MKQIQIEFVQDRRWRWLWCISALLAMVGALAMIRYEYQNYQEKLDLKHQIDGIRSQLLIKPKAININSNSKQASSLKAAELLQFDLNKVFSTIENIAEPSTRLINISFDANAGSLRLEYELDSTEVAVKLTEKLNSGYDVRPWLLDNLSTQRASGSNGIANTAQKTIGVWRCNVKSI